MTSRTHTTHTTLSHRITRGRKSSINPQPQLTPRVYTRIPRTSKSHGSSKRTGDNHTDAQRRDAESYRGRPPGRAAPLEPAAAEALRESRGEGCLPMERGSGAEGSGMRRGNSGKRRRRRDAEKGRMLGWVSCPELGKGTRQYGGPRGCTHTPELGKAGLRTEPVRRLVQSFTG
jgi:hypothetical protein